LHRPIHPRTTHRSETRRDAGTGRAIPSAGVQADWWGQVQENIQKEEYHVTWQDDTVLPDVKGGWQAPNRAQGFRTHFTDEGIRVVPRTGEMPSWEWGFPSFPNR